MRIARSRFLLLLGSLVSMAAAALTPDGKVPANVILVKGAWASASDSTTPLPESGRVTVESYDNPYFGLTLGLPRGWLQKYEGPPPSDSGYYVLAQLRPADDGRSQIRGTVLIAAQDLFFTPTRATGPLELVNYTRDHLRADYRVEKPPTRITLAGRDFVRLDYVSPVAGLHWSMLATQLRCHVVEFIFTSTDPHLLDSLEHSMSSMKVRSSTADEPVCVKNYAVNENIVERVDPVFTEQRYNPVPVRVIIDRQGKVKHIHFLSAFPGQSQAINAALTQWRFKPFLRDGQPVEVETGILFGRAPRAAL